MTDPLAEVISLLQPRAVFSRPISGAGRWGVRYSAFGEPSFCAVLEGSCRLTVDGHVPLTLEAGDFVLLPATPGFTMSGFEPVRFEHLDPKVMSKRLGEVRHGTRGGRPDVRLLGGWFAFESRDSALLVSLLPSVVHVRSVERLSVLVRIVGEEASNEGQAAISCSRASSRYCSSKRCDRRRVKTRLRASCAGWPMPASRPRYGRCTVSLLVDGQWPSSHERPQCRALRSSSVSLESLASRQWNICSPGVWPSRRICCGARS